MGDSSFLPTNRLPGASTARGPSVRRSATLGFLPRIRAAEQLRRRTQRRVEARGGGEPQSSLSAPVSPLVPVLVPVRGRSGENSVERGGSRNLTQARWPQGVAEDPRGDHSSPSNGLRTCRSPVRVGAGALKS